MNVAIAGYGVEGRSSYRYFSRLGHSVTVLDQNPQAEIPSGVTSIVGEHAFDALASYDLVVRAPGIKPTLLSGAAKLTSATIEFFDKCPASVIGVTGTKGKGTTSSLIHSIITAAGRKAWLVGNIGTPALDVLSEINEDDVVVFEMSSFQLWDLQKSPHVAVVLMIEADHLDVHSGMDEYVSAKANIAAHQSGGDIVVYNQSNNFSKVIAGLSEGKKIPYPDPRYVHIRDDNILIGEQKLCAKSVVKLPGDHNLENVCAAISAVLDLKIEDESIISGISSFEGLPHRIEFVRSIDDVDYYNDSYSSATLASIAAMKSFKQPKVLILGGFSRGIDFAALAQEIRDNNVKKVVLIGQTKEQLSMALDRVGYKEYEILKSTDMREIVDAAKSAAQSGDVVLLSPACPSFDMFKNFSDRGDQFKSIVNGL
jgi:UDP-N-acetylmuramoylalanine--D-glutamate ligase